ncbi:hypothetical protein [Abyssalbus ytuae]|uniref:Uncharacterized protein n=1 Tax=Abyssalbus ytuae TaxID=2926907 RepID=A0A9E6ZXQ2_9FLAO|nr:hypothetical protein [Abyssalbus ytuae]UOB17092.1 hypothetical protein MQE35_15295 [Abyssalbus ytuae]
MKIITKILAIMLLAGCSSTRLIDSWRNPDYLYFTPQKVLIVGVSHNLTARKIFEVHLKNEFNMRNIEADESYEIFDSDFTNTKQTDEDIQKQLDKVVGKGYDVILISTVKGVDEKTSYTRGHSRVDYTWRRFRGYYLLYQDIYHDPGYYENYRVYNIESALYNIEEDSEKSLVWVASYDLVDPKGIQETVEDYVDKIIKDLEKENLIPRRNKNKP